MDTGSGGGSRTIVEQLGTAVALYGPVGGFTPDPTDPTHYKGTKTTTVAPDVTATLTSDLRQFTGAS
jgi:hypothetical protein